MIDKYDLGNGMIANDEQKLAIDKMINFLRSDKKEFTLIGKAGTGKTTIIKKIVQYYNDSSSGSSMFNSNVVAATISHAAKNVLRKALGNTFITTVTVAKLLGMKMNINEEGQIEFLPEPKTWKVAPPPIKHANLIIIDECSMISKGLLSLIREHRPKNTKTIFMGDWHQLPPIDSQRNQDEDSITFSIENKAVLNKRMRQKETNPVINLSDLYADNIDKFIDTGDFDQKPLKGKHRLDNYNPITNEGIIFPDNVTSTFSLMLKDFKKGHELKETNFVKAIAFRNRNMYGKAPYNISSINNTVRKHLWKSEEQFVEGELIVANNQFVINKELLFQNGDSMIVVSCKHEIFNQIECCILTLMKEDKTLIYNIPVVSKKGRKEYKNILAKLVKQARADRNKWKKYYNFIDSFANISYGYAITSHKAQGSGYKNIYIFEDDIMEIQKTTFKEKQQCMYTAITRTIEKCVIFSTKN